MPRECAIRVDSGPPGVPRHVVDFPAGRFPGGAAWCASATRISHGRHVPVAGPTRWVATVGGGFGRVLSASGNSPFRGRERSARRRRADASPSPLWTSTEIHRVQGLDAHSPVAVRSAARRATSRPERGECQSAPTLGSSSRSPGRRPVGPRLSPERDAAPAGESFAAGQLGCRAPGPRAHVRGGGRDPRFVHAPETNPPPE